MLCRLYDLVEFMVFEVFVVGKDFFGVYDKIQQENYNVDFCGFGVGLCYLRLGMIYFLKVVFDLLQDFGRDRSFEFGLLS